MNICNILLENYVNELVDATYTTNLYIGKERYIKINANDALLIIANKIANLKTIEDYHNLSIVWFDCWDNKNNKNGDVVVSIYDKDEFDIEQDILDPAAKCDCYNDRDLHKIVLKLLSLKLAELTK